MFQLPTVGWLTLAEFYYFALCTVCATDIKLTVEPSVNVIAGGHFNLSCWVNSKGFPIVWTKDNKEIGEDCKLFNIDDRITCVNLANAYILRINPVTWTDRGQWACSHGPKWRQLITMHIIVPAFVHPPSILPVRLPVIQPANRANSNDPTSLTAESQDLALHVVGNGTRDDPVDLTGQQVDAAKAVIVRCRSSCASVKHYLQWKHRNSTWTSALRPQVMHFYPSPVAEQMRVDEPPIIERCPEGLQSVSGQVRIACDSVTSNAVDLNKLVGLNRITCRVHYNEEQRFVDDLLVDHSPALPSSPVGRSPAWGENPVEECSPIGQQQFTCIYLLCAGHKTPWLTFGERVALVTAVPLCILFGVLLRQVSKQSRRASQKNLLLPRQHDAVEVML
ncbi:unnamed protein product [Dicrocoelium dendriticum]|nr:unnamed protein product [Dicrocoelium dendriticum]